MKDKESITITKEEYLDLRYDSLKLEMLEAGGVDNWNGYSESLYHSDYYEKDFNELCDEIKKEINMEDK